MSRKLLFFSACTLLILVAWAAPADAGGSCSAWVDCSDGSTQDCSGASSCLVGSDYVECDGSRFSCPTTCCSAELICDSNVYSSAWYISCDDCSSSASCTKGTDYVKCGDETITCQECEDGTRLCLAAAE